MSSWRHPRKGVHALLLECERQGCTVKQSSHFKIYRGHRLLFVVAGSPRGDGTLRIKHDMRRAGIDII